MAGSVGANSPRAASILKYGLLALGALFMVLPFLDMFLGALKTPAEIIARPPKLIPADPQWNVFLEIFNQIPILRWYANSIIVTSSVTLFVLFTSSMAGFALAKYRFPGRTLIFNGILSAMMFPLFLFLIPVYFMMRYWPLAGGNDLLGMGGTGFLGTYTALILPFAVSWWGIFMMRQFIVGLPDDILDAARIDGCSEFRIYTHIVLPLIKPALATLAIFVFIAQWNEFIWTMTVTRSAPDLQTLPVGIHLLRDTFDPLRNEALRRATIAVSTIPMTVVFLALQRYYVKGIAMTGIKG
jgi:multiple sugar transport system permease protein